jgi:hypothetical protein
MLRTSRCFAGTLLQLGGPDALSSVVRYPYQFHLSNLSFAPITVGFLTRFRFTKRVFGLDTFCKLGPSLLATAKRTILFATAPWLTAHKLGGNLAMQLVAIG